jgi:Heparinase II/III-like protein
MPAPLSRRDFLRANSSAALLALLPRRARAAAGPAAPAELLAATAFVRGAAEAELVGLVPVQSGLHFVGCANCHHGAQEDQLVWSPERPGEVVCRYCGEVYPDAKYPLRAAVRVRTPRGGSATYPYWADPSGYRYFFPARRDDGARAYLAARAEDLAQLYAATGDAGAARRAALILDRFAEVFPGWCYHYDYPFRQKEIYSGVVPPSEFRPNFRTARWTWWAYLDVPIELVRAYEGIRGSGALEALSRERGLDVAARIRRDLFRSAADQVMANPETDTNMSPTAWRSLVEAGRALGDPRYGEEVRRRLGRFARTQFFYDGSWHESASYALQTVNGLNQVVGAFRGAEGGPAPSGLLGPAHAAVLRLWLPDGRLVPVGDTWTAPPPGGVGRWAAMSGAGAVPSGPAYLLPAHGRACVEAGRGAARTQFHLTWSGGYGHQHADNQSLLVFAHGREMLSDLGYTHSAYRVWATATAAHNTVVIDGRNQAPGSREAPSDGSLLRFARADPRVQVVATDGIRAYPGLARAYGRTLVVADAGRGRRYAVDLFRVEGGRTHDYFLHGDADRPASAAAEVDLAPLGSLLPAGFAWRAPRDEADGERRADEPHYTYGFLRELRGAEVPAGRPIAVRFRDAERGAPGLRVTLVPEEDSQLILGRDPSIRRAHEDDAKLERYLRPFAALRRRAADGRSRFVSVLEPFAEAPFIDAVERLPTPGAELVLRIRMEDRVHVLVAGAAGPVSVPAEGAEATYQGDVGLLCLRGGSVEHAFALGRGGWRRGSYRLDGEAPGSASLRAVEGRVFRLGGVEGGPPRSGEVVRVLTSDGWTYPYTVEAAEAEAGGLRIRVAEGPGLAFDAAAGRLRLTAFPQREHTGPVRVEWA